MAGTQKKCSSCGINNQRFSCSCCDRVRSNRGRKNKKSSRKEFNSTSSSSPSPSCSPFRNQSHSPSSRQAYKQKSTQSRIQVIKRDLAAQIETFTHLDQDSKSTPVVSRSHSFHSGNSKGKFRSKNNDQSVKRSASCREGYIPPAFYPKNKTLRKN